MVSKGLALKTISEKYKFPFIKDMACEREHMKFEKYHVKFCFLLFYAYVHTNVARRYYGLVF